MNKVLVTGGAGFIGSHLVDELLRRGNEVVVLDNLINGSLDNLTHALQNNNCTFIEGSILSKSDLERCMKQVDVVYHLACMGVRHSLHSPKENHDVNATGTLNALEAGKAEGVKKFFYISTSEVYGKVDTFPIKETYLPKPITVYGSSKLVGEHYTISYTECFGLDATVIRIFNNYGPRAHYEGDAGEIIPRTIVKALYGQPPVIFGDGSVTRDFFYVKDTARVLCDLMKLDGLKGDTFNLGTGLEISMKELVHTILLNLPDFKGEIEYLQDRPADVPRLWVDSSKLRAVLPYKPEVTFENGIKNTIEYYKALKQSKDLLKDLKTINWSK